MNLLQTTFLHLGSPKFNILEADSCPEGVSHGLIEPHYLVSGTTGILNTRYVPAKIRK